MNLLQKWNGADGLDKEFYILLIAASLLVIWLVSLIPAFIQMSHERETACKNRGGSYQSTGYTSRGDIIYSCVDKDGKVIVP